MKTKIKHVCMSCNGDKFHIIKDGEHMLIGCAGLKCETKDYIIL